MVSDLARLKRDLAEERGNLRAAVVMLALSAASLVLGLALVKYLIGFLVMPLSVAGGTFGVALALYYSWSTWVLHRKIESVAQLPAARVIQR